MIAPKELIKGITRPPPDISKRSNTYRFDRNERTTLFSDDEFQSMLSTLTPYDLVAYGELEPFYDGIKRWLNVDRDNILLTSGSDTGIKAVFEAFVEKDDEVLNLLPNYAMFSVYSRMFGAREVKRYYEKDLTLNVAEFISEIHEKTKLVIISNPGHTGTVIDEEDLIRIGETATNHGSLFLVDEAYHHFYPKTMIGYFNQLKNMLVVRTFSKAFGLASLRMGILIGCKELISELYRVKLVHEITGVAGKIGMYMLDHLEIMNNHVNSVNEGKELLYKKLPELGIKVLRSESNFVFFKLPKDKDKVYLISALNKEDIYIKGPFNDHPFDGHLRVTVGDVSQMDLFYNSIKNIISKGELGTNGSF